jgi:hypothetical protein
VDHSFSIAAQVGNTAEATWLSSATQSTTGAVSLVLDTLSNGSSRRNTIGYSGEGDSDAATSRVIGRLPVSKAVGWMATAQLGPSTFKIDQSSIVMMRVRMEAAGAAVNAAGRAVAAAFGPSFKLQVSRGR